MNQNEDLEEKRLLGSGGYAFAKLTEQEEIKASLGVPQIVKYSRKVKRRCVGYNAARSIH